MPVPTIDPESSVLAYPQWVEWEHTFSATNAPTSWSIVSGSVPTGMEFQPATAVTGENADDIIDAADHPFTDGNVVIFSSLTGGSGLALATRYFVVNKDTNSFQLATTPGGAPISLGSDVTAATLYRPGYLVGAATLPGISKIRLAASNGSGASAEVLFTIGIEPAAAAPDANTDFVWNMGTNDIIVQTSSVLDLVPEKAEQPLFVIKEGDDWFGRIRLVKNGTVLDLDMEDNALRMVLKEFEPEPEMPLTSASIKRGTGSSTSYLLYGKFESAALSAALANYETDDGTGYDFLAEFEITYSNSETIGPASLVRSSKTFRVRVDRDLANNP